MQISLNGFCALGGLTNSRLSTRVVRNQRGQYLFTIYIYN